MSIAAAALVATVLSAPAAGQPSTQPPVTAVAPAGDDVVYLKSGGFVRGTVQQYEPGGSVVLLLADGTLQTLEPSQVDRVAIGGAQTRPQTPKPRGPSSAETRVHLVRADGGSSDIALMRRTGGAYVSGPGGSASGVSWANTCTAPCGRLIDTNGVYFINGTNKGPLLASKPLNLHEYRGRDVTLEVSGGRTGLMLGGMLLVSAGTVAAAVSPVFLVGEDDGMPTGVAMVAAGTGALVGGIIMMVRGRHRVKARRGRPKR